MGDNSPRDGFDDWFDEPGPPDAWTARVDRIVRERERAHDVEDWVEETAPVRQPRAAVPRRPVPVLLGLGALAICLLLGILAAAGVFSGGSRPGAAATTVQTATRTGTTATTSTNTAPAVTVPTTQLVPGATGVAVKQLQRALAQAGYFTGAVDGSYGPATKSAVAKFQQAHGLTADGVAGPKTLRALAAALQQASG